MSLCKAASAVEEGDEPLPSLLSLPSLCACSDSDADTDTDTDGEACRADYEDEESSSNGISNGISNGSNSNRRSNSTNSTNRRSNSTNSTKDSTEKSIDTFLSSLVSSFRRSSSLLKSGAFCHDDGAASVSVAASATVNAPIKQHRRSSQLRVDSVLIDVVVLEDNPIMHCCTHTKLPPAHQPHLEQSTAFEFEYHHGHHSQHSNHNNHNEHESDSCDNEIMHNSSSSSNDNSFCSTQHWNPKTDSVVGFTHKCRWQTMADEENASSTNITASASATASAGHWHALHNTSASSIGSAGDRDTAHTNTNTNTNPQSPRPTTLPTTTTTLPPPTATAMASMAPLKMPRRRISIEVQPFAATTKMSKDSPIKTPRRMNSISSCGEESFNDSDSDSDSDDVSIESDSSPVFERRLPKATNSFLLATKKFKRRGAIIQMSKAQILAACSQDAFDSSSSSSSSSSSTSNEDGSGGSSNVDGSDGSQGGDGSAHHDDNHLDYDYGDEKESLGTQFGQLNDTIANISLEDVTSTTNTNTTTLTFTQAHESTASAPALPKRRPSVQRNRNKQRKNKHSAHKSNASNGGDNSDMVNNWLRKSTYEQLAMVEQALRELDADTVSRRRGAVLASADSEEFLKPIVALSYGGSDHLLQSSSQLDCSSLSNVEHDAMSAPSSEPASESWQEQIKVFKALQDIQHELTTYRRGGMTIAGSSREASEEFRTLDDEDSEKEEIESSMELNDVFPALRNSFQSDQQAKKATRQETTQHQLQSLAKALKRVASRTISSKIPSRSPKKLFRRKASATVTTAVGEKNGAIKV